MRVQPNHLKSRFIPALRRGTTTSWLSPTSLAWTNKDPVQYQRWALGSKKYSTKEKPKFLPLLRIRIQIRIYLKDFAN